jgi:hypothetical protein
VGAFTKAMASAFGALDACAGGVGRALLPNPLGWVASFTVSVDTSGHVKGLDWNPGNALPPKARTCIGNVIREQVPFPSNPSSSAKLSDRKYHFVQQALWIVAARGQSVATVPPYTLLPDGLAQGLLAQRSDANVCAGSPVGVLSNAGVAFVLAADGTVASTAVLAHARNWPEDARCLANWVAGTKFLPPAPGELALGIVGTTEARAAWDEVLGSWDRERRAADSKPSETEKEQAAGRVAHDALRGRGVVEAGARRRDYETQIDAALRADLAPKVAACLGRSSKSAAGIDEDRLRFGFAVDGAGVHNVWVEGVDWNTEQCVLRSVRDFEPPGRRQPPSLPDVFEYAWVDGGPLPAAWESQPVTLRFDEIYRVPVIEVRAPGLDSVTDREALLDQTLMQRALLAGRSDLLACHPGAPLRVRLGFSVAGDGRPGKPAFELLDGAAGSAPSCVGAWLARQVFWPANGATPASYAFELLFGGQPEEVQLVEIAQLEEMVRLRAARRLDACLEVDSPANAAAEPISLRFVLDAFGAATDIVVEKPEGLSPERSDCLAQALRSTPFPQRRTLDGALASPRTFFFRWEPGAAERGVVSR